MYINFMMYTIEILVLRVHSKRRPQGRQPSKRPSCEVLILTILMDSGAEREGGRHRGGPAGYPDPHHQYLGGIKGVNQKLIDMSRAYHASRQRIICSVIVPRPHQVQSMY
jgi:hypothetical protein